MTARSHTRTMHKLKKRIALRNYKWRERIYYRSLATRGRAGHGKQHAMDAARDSRMIAEERERFGSDG